LHICNIPDEGWEMSPPVLLPEAWGAAAVLALQAGQPRAVPRQTQKAAGTPGWLEAQNPFVSS